MCDALDLVWDYLTKADRVERLNSSMRYDEADRIAYLEAHDDLLNSNQQEWVRRARAYFQENGFLSKRFEETVDSLRATVERKLDIPAATTCRAPL